MYYGKDKDVVVSKDETREAFSFLLYTIFLTNTELDAFIAYGNIFYYYVDTKVSLVVSVGMLGIWHRNFWLLERGHVW